MKFLISLIATSLLSFAACLVLPWWSIAGVAFAVAALIPQRTWKSFSAGFLGVFLLWLGLTLWIDRENGGVLSARMVQVLPVGGQVLYLHLLTAAVGGLVGGLAAISGQQARSLLAKKPS